MAEPRKIIRRRRQSVGAVVAVVCLAACASLRADAQGTQKVSISGGADASGHNYTWTVTNHGGSPIVYIEYPHNQADLFFAPSGWSTHSTNLVNVGVKTPFGVCTATADGPSSGITRGASAEFKMRIAPAGAPRGAGDVRVRFADDSEEVVHGVELPAAASLGETYTPLIALGGIFVVFLVIQGARKRSLRRRQMTSE